MRLWEISYKGVVQERCHLDAQTPEQAAEMFQAGAGCLPVTAREIPPEQAELIGLLARSGMSQRAAAHAIDISPRMLQYMLSGRHRVQLRTLLALRWVISEQSAS